MNILCSFWPYNDLQRQVFNGSLTLAVGPRDHARTGVSKIRPPLAAQLEHGGERVGGLEESTFAAGDVGHDRCATAQASNTESVSLVHAPV